ncbi:DinB family protein [Flammeovirga sp. EKP202]|uniref:DinB family protein n=1 Tax=Flammeovirga sp. EKP202 TaxID=2770592 RepID=UPI00165FBCFA|nr:DinB family protein [Flammeovirga sp. EKP202]MBD0404894.1 DinB family protein [Flammeovirga sp. EKP202]
MKNTTTKLEQLVHQGVEFLSKATVLDLTTKSSPEKWSKKEILGHLIDSGVNNLQRFTEIQFENKPFKIVSYNQDELVKANDYQNADIMELLVFWKAINNRIKIIMEKQTSETLAYPILLGNEEVKDLEFLMKDYVVHLEHHLHQIIDK